MAGIPSEPQSGLPTITVADLHDSVHLLDVREDDEWEAGRAPHAVHIPLAQLPDRLDEMPKEKPIVVTCRGGGRSARAVTFLREQGYDAANLEGGMMAWQRANRPMTHDGSGCPEVR